MGSAELSKRCLLCWAMCIWLKLLGRIRQRRQESEASTGLDAAIFRYGGLFQVLSTAGAAHRRIRCTDFLDSQEDNRHPLQIQVWLGRFLGANEPGVVVTDLSTTSQFGSKIPHSLTMFRINNQLSQ